MYIQSRASVLWGCTQLADHTDWLNGGDLAKDFQMLFMRKSVLGEKKDMWIQSMGITYGFDFHFALLEII